MHLCIAFDHHAEMMIIFNRDKKERDHMRKREGMKKRRSRILAWLLACFMVLSVIQGTGWGSLTVQAEEEVNRLVDLEIEGDWVINDGTVKKTEGTGWSYDADTNALTLTNANLKYIGYDGGTLNLQINGENTISTIDAKKNSLYITGTKKDKLNGNSFTHIDFFTVENIEVNVSEYTVANIIKLKDVNLSSNNISVKTFSCSGCLIKATEYLGIEELFDCSDSEFISAETIYGDEATKKYTNSIEVDNSNNIMRIYGAATLCQNLTIPSNYTIWFAEGASITNLDKLTVNEGANIYVNYRVNEDGFDDYDVHEHNTDGGVTCEWKDADTHVKKSVCKDCPVAYIAETEPESHHYNEQGFCTECDAYQPAVLTTDQYDINGDNSKDNVYEISNAGQLYWFAGLVNGTLPCVDQNTSANAVLTNDITVNENVLVGGKLADDPSEFRNWTPIADNLIIDGTQYGYNGIFDGQNHSISGIYCDSPYRKGSECGFFVYIDLKSIVRDFSVKDSYITSDACNMLGGITGLNNGKIQGCSFDGLITGNSYIGGICGRNERYGNITECYNYGELIAATEGGVTVAGSICAENHSTVTKSGNYGNVKADQSVGGITGDNGGSIVDCYNQGNVNMSSGGYWVGGICGCMDDASITNGYNVGNVTGSGERGEIYGYLQGNNIVTNCYYLSDTEIDDNKDMAGKTKEQSASGKVAYLLQEKCKDAVWGQTLSEEG